MNCWSILTFRAFIGPPDGNTFAVRITFPSAAMLRRGHGLITRKGAIEIVYVWPKKHVIMTTVQVWVQAGLSKGRQELVEEVASLPSTKKRDQIRDTWWCKFPSKAPWLVLLLLWSTPVVIWIINSFEVYVLHVSWCVVYWDLMFFKKSSNSIHKCLFLDTRHMRQWR